MKIPQTDVAAFMVATWSWRHELARQYGATWRDRRTRFPEYGIVCKHGNTWSE